MKSKTDREDEEALAALIVEKATERQEFSLADIATELETELYADDLRKVCPEVRSFIHQGVMGYVRSVLRSRTIEHHRMRVREFMALEDGPKAHWILVVKMRNYQATAAYILIRKKTQQMVKERNNFRAYIKVRFGFDPEEKAKLADEQDREE